MDDNNEVEFKKILVTEKHSGELLSIIFSLTNVVLL